MHPTADTQVLKYLQSHGAAGDAGRYGSALGWLIDDGRLRAVECGVARKVSWGRSRRGVLLHIVAVPVAGTGGGNSALHHNKPMHPTRLSAALIINVLGGRVIGGVRRPE
jgi:hypothetical protein